MFVNVEVMEKIALSNDREASVQQFVPETEESYFHSILSQQVHEIETGSADAKDIQLRAKLIEQGKNKFRHSQLEGLAVREQLLRYEKVDNTKKEEITKDLITRLKLNVQHSKKVERHESDQQQNQHPSKLDQKLLDLDYVLATTLSSDGIGSLNPLCDEWLAKLVLTKEQLASFIQQLERPCLSNLVDLIDSDMKQNQVEFGSRSIHSCLTKEQLQKLKAMNPNLASNSTFFITGLKRFQPSSLDNLTVEEKAEFFNKCWKYVENAPPVLNTYKATVMYHCLEFNKRQGNLDFDKFMKYLEMPRSGYPFIYRPEYPNVIQNLSAYVGILPPPENEQSLREYYFIQMFLRDDGKNVSDFKDYVDQNYLQQLLAETKILFASDAKHRDPWINFLSSSKLEQLKNRVDIEFAPTNPQRFNVEDEMKLTVFLKNVQTLVIKVFKINTRAYYRTQMKEIDGNIELEGYTAAFEEVKDFSKVDSFHKFRHELSFPKLNKERGVFVIELLGNGRQCRALIRKGQLNIVQYPSAVGHIFRIYDEKNKPVNGSLSIAGHMYSADSKTGLVTVPYVPTASREDIVIIHSEDGEFSALGRFGHLTENYEFTCGLYVDREALLQKANAELIIRPTLLMNNYPVPLSEINKITLMITSKNSNNVKTTQVINDIKFQENKEIIQSFSVPERLRSIEFVISVDVKVRTTNTTQTLTQSKSFELNKTDETDHLEEFYLRYDDSGYKLYLLGKSGEARAHVNIDVTLSHTHVFKTFHSRLQTDEDGKVILGDLRYYSNITAQLATSDSYSPDASSDNTCYGNFTISPLRTINQINFLTAIEGEDIHIPYTGEATQISSLYFSLLDEDFAHDYTTTNLKYSKDDRSLVITGLKRGKYSLRLREFLVGNNINILIAKGEKIVDNMVVEPKQLVEISQLKRLQIVSVTEKDEKDGVIEVQLSGVQFNTRVHLVATHFYPEYSMVEPFSSTHNNDPKVFDITILPSLYYPHQSLSDEYQYIIDRKLSKKYVGNTLPRPSLLLNEKVKQDTTQSEPNSESVKSRSMLDDSLMDRPVPRAAAMKHYMRVAERKARIPMEGLHNLEFLSSSSTRILNQKVDDSGKVRIARKSIGLYQTHLLVIAFDGNYMASYRAGLKDLVEKKNKNGELVLHPAYQDTRLLPGLDPLKHVTERYLISSLQTGERMVINDLYSARVEVFETLDHVFGIFTTLSKASPNGQRLRTFSFLMNWPNLSENEKLEKYSEFSCHEFNFFLYQKDRTFFEKVVKIFIKDKLQKTFMDEYLLGNDLSCYLTPFLFSRLNVLEKLLLSTKFPKELKAITDTIVNAFVLQKKDPVVFISLFETVLSSRSLDSKNQENIRNKPPVHEPEKEKQKDRRVVHKKKQDKKEESNLFFDEEGEEQAFYPTNMRVTPLSSLSYNMAMPVPRQTYREPDQTKEYEERHYYDESTASKDLIRVNAFWVDVAAHFANSFADQKEQKQKQPFLSRNICEASSSFAEMITALSLVDLPFVSSKHEVKDNRNVFDMTAASPVIIFHKEVKEADSDSLSNSAGVSVSQHYFDPLDKIEQKGEEGTGTDKYIENEFLSGRIYGCRVVLTNITSLSQQIEVLQQIPSGSIPITYDSKPGFITKTEFMEIGGFSTLVREYYFYFPALGTFRHYPVHVSKKSKIIGFGIPRELKVVSKPSTPPDNSSWNYVSQHGSEQAVLDFLKERNLHQVDLTLICWRLRKHHDFFNSVIEILLQRHIFHYDIFAYSLVHHHQKGMQAFLPHNRTLKSFVGPYFKSSLLTVDSTRWFEDDTYKHLEYYPLVNSRAHKLRRVGEQQNIEMSSIQNNQFLRQYKNFLTYIIYRYSNRKNWKLRESLAATYYMLLQDRIDDALSIFQQCKKEKEKDNGYEIQCDYMAAYLDMFNLRQSEIPLKMAKKYLNYPILKKRKLFYEVQEQVYESAVNATPSHELDEKQSRERHLDNLAATEPSLDFKIESKKININYQNIAQCTINFYNLDIELLFSTNPFMGTSNGSQSLFVSPNQSITVTLSKEKKSESVDIPSVYHNANAFVEVTGGGVSRCETLFSHSLSLQLIENYGQIKVLNSQNNQPLPRVYTKVYSRNKDGSVTFYKDGYTDTRGRFDYVSLSSKKLHDVQKFAILVLSENNGAIVRDADPVASVRT